MNELLYRNDSCHELKIVPNSVDQCRKHLCLLVFKCVILLRILLTQGP
jgi:hypothetical protein